MRRRRPERVLFRLFQSVGLGQQGSVGKHLQILGAESSYAKAVRTSLLKKTKRNCTLRMTIEMITVQPLKEECRRMFLQIFTPSFLLQC